MGYCWSRPPVRIEAGNRLAVSAAKSYGPNSHCHVRPVTKPTSRQYSHDELLLLRVCEGIRRFVKVSYLRGSSQQAIRTMSSSMAVSSWPTLATAMSSCDAAIISAVAMRAKRRVSSSVGTA